MQLYLAQKIYKESLENRDSTFIKPYSNLIVSNLFVSEFDAYIRLIKNDFLRKLIYELKKQQIDSLIGGSIPLSCVWEKGFDTDDIDLYVKNVNLETLLKIENIIKKITKIKEFVVVRGPMTLTWHITTMYNDYHIVQVNILKIESWAELFISYHSDIVCLGYDILKSQFVYLDGRWEEILQDKTRYFSSVFNVDNPYTLKKACAKYNRPGFDCCIREEENKNKAKKEQYGYSVYFPPCTLSFSTDEYQETLNMFKDDTPLIKGNYLPKPIVKNELLYKLCLKYRGCTNIHFGKSVIENYTSSIVPISAIGYLNPITMQPNVVNKEYKDFFESPKTFKKCIQVQCPICFNKYDIDHFIAQACHTTTKKVCHHLHSSLIFNGFDIVVPIAKICYH